MSSAPRFWYEKSALATLLQPAACVFRALVELRRAAFRRGLFAQERIAVPVVVIGNISVGGTGKTPLVAWLAGEMSNADLKPGIVSRGYGGQANRRPSMVTEASDPADVGDEPVVLARQTGVPICICADRVAAARCLLAQADVNIIISDDGLQHYTLARDLEFAVLDGERMLGNGRFMPAGPLRESAERLREVDLVLVNGGASSEAGHVFTISPGDAIELHSGVARALSEFSGTRVWSVAGIGNPARFHAMLESFDIDTECVDVPDHGVISLEHLRARNPYPILMTEKDAVKYLASPVTDVWYVPVTVSMPQATTAAVMKRIRTTIESRAIHV